MIDISSVDPKQPIKIIVGASSQNHTLAGYRRKNMN